MNTKSKTKKYTLHEMRELSKKTGRTVCRLCHTTYQSLRNWETGTTIPDVVIVDKLLRVYEQAYDNLDLTLFNKTASLPMHAHKKTHSLEQNKKLTLLEMRRNGGLTGDEAANLSGITYRSLRNWETGANIPDIISIDNLLNIYGYTFNELNIDAFREIKNKQIERHMENEM